MTAKIFQFVRKPSTGKTPRKNATSSSGAEVVPLSTVLLSPVTRPAAFPVPAVWTPPR